MRMQIGVPQHDGASVNGTGNSRSARKETAKLNCAAGLLGSVGDGDHGRRTSTVIFGFTIAAPAARCDVGLPPRIRRIFPVLA
jgi:hypothetical protein